MANGFSLQFRCTGCEADVSMPLRPSAKLPWVAACPSCGKRFGIEAGTISRQIKLFISLCQQIKASEEILSRAAVAVSIGSTEVKVPYQLLLTRLKSVLDLSIEGQKVSIIHRSEPLKIDDCAVKATT